MKFVVVYDSYFGNTERIAQSIGAGMGGRDTVQVVRVDAATPEMVSDAHMLVVGSPTRAFGPTPKLMKFINALPRQVLKKTRIAAFDTRIPAASVNSKILAVAEKLFGWAAPRLANRLVARGAIEVALPEGFCVRDSQGPLRDGEEARAVAWGRLLCVLA